MNSQPTLFQASIRTGLGFGIGGLVAVLVLLILPDPVLVVLGLCLDGAIVGLSLRRGFKLVVAFVIAFPLTALGFYIAALAAVADLASSPAHERLILPILGVTFWLSGSLGALPLRSLGTSAYVKAVFSFGLGAIVGILAAIGVLVVQSWPSAGSAISAYIAGFLVAHVAAGVFLGALLPRRRQGPVQKP